MRFVDIFTAVAMICCIQEEEEINVLIVKDKQAMCRIMFANINGLQDNLDELAVVASHFDIVFCCETKATRRSRAAELRLPGYHAPVLLARGSRPNGLGMVMYSRSGLAVSIVYF